MNFLRNIVRNERIWWWITFVLLVVINARVMCGRGHMSTLQLIWVFSWVGIAFSYAADGVVFIVKQFKLGENVSKDDFEPPETE